MENEMIDNNPRGVLSGILITIISAFVSALFFASFFTIAYIKKLPYEKPQALILQITSILVTVGLTQFLSRKVQGNKLSAMQAFIGGWMSSLVLALFISSFYTIFSSITGKQLLPKGAFALVLMLYSGIGIFISLILTFIFKKE